MIALWCRKKPETKQRTSTTTTRTTTVSHCCYSKCHLLVVRQRCQSLRLFIGPQQGLCSAVSPSILGDWWSRPWLGLKGTLSPPMKREISLLVLLACPTNPMKLSVQHTFCISSLLQCWVRLNVSASTFTHVSVWILCWWLNLLSVITIYLKEVQLSLKSSSKWQLQLSREPSKGF